MPVIAERRQIDKGDRRARTGAIGLEHCMREARFKIVVVHRVEPDLRQEVAFAKPPFSRGQLPGAGTTARRAITA